MMNMAQPVCPAVGLWSFFPGEGQDRWEGVWAQWIGEDFVL